VGFLFYDLCPPVKPALCKAVPPGVYETARKRFRSIFISYPVRNKIMEAWAGKGVRNYQNNWGKRFKSKKKQYVKGADIYDKVKAQRYASSKTGKPYSVAATKKAQINSIALNLCGNHTKTQKEPT